MKKLLMVGILLLAGCAAKTITTSDELYLYKVQVAHCIGLSPDAYGKAHVDTVPGSTVSCFGQVVHGCYHDGTITVPQKVTESTLKHEFVHFFADKALGCGDDVKHSCAGKFYLECGGLVTE